MAEVEDTSWLEEPAPVADDEAWLVEDPNAGKTTQAFRHLIDACMRGTNRVMACDGHYLAYRPYNHEFDKQANPATLERFSKFQAAGYYKHLGTYDEVQIYELEEGSPFRHSSAYVVGVDKWRDIRQAATLACERKWADYHDLLGGMATAFKGSRDPVLARSQWNDMLDQLAITIRQMGGPPDAEVNAGFVGVRNARGIGKDKRVMTLNSAGLQKVQMA
jgi:hypothetical protein